MNIFPLRTAALAFPLLLLVLSGCNDPVVKKSAPVVSVVVDNIVQTRIRPQYDFIGRTEATEDVSIRAQVDGVLLKRHFTAGDDVQKNDLLFEIDPAPYQTQVSQQKASLKYTEHMKLLKIVGNEALG
jgi:membrane fusion protein (multidrug efflux system)